MSSRRHTVVLALVSVVLLAAPAGAGPLEPDLHQHYNYPPVPNGLSAIRSTFGAPCNAAANDNSFEWTAADNGVAYVVRFHRKLGGTASSNLYPDVYFHFQNGGYSAEVTHGIYGYACRYVAGTTKYSTHAWGIAVDINSAADPNGDATCNTVTAAMGRIWTDHRWTWGKAWKDCMHFQYAAGY